MGCVRFMTDAYEEVNVRALSAKLIVSYLYHRCNNSAHMDTSLSGARKLINKMLGVKGKSRIRVIETGASS